MREKYMDDESGCMHSTYLPFSESQLRSHFADVRKGNNECTGAAGKHIEYYKRNGVKA